ncbi:hypothetical protein NCU01893 [Neurospora crassa OR74A]|uniref:Uncharacterized protein n=1 Tax=Neurospora crassa (strain ATCC 24698 / 74-OR23-1A / CBS 708.71 / DSM 1257 / FGSC 987) TaxID=367110 RepID=Q7SHB3_NEUCR|nr:hypothetical protein NCU01893 [Neurospora crassa OR74A]EAA36288.2 hypothetical protein NCU01893 [Neurospora crassa OR74A]|eukprot:XP_965524.2 hypothetical protein NCU01893 [Neurospora crassa OR74A]
MSTLGSSLKRSFTPSQIMRPNMPRRTLSGSSHGSCPSPSPLSDEQFAFSAGNTPVREIPPSYVASAGYNSMTGTPRDALLFGTREVNSKSQTTTFVSESKNASKVITRSKPIAIELPSTRRLSTAPVETPPSPLSARGDIQGGYFPHHEDPATRVHRPHPFFTLDPSKARHQALHKAAETTHFSVPLTDSRVRTMANDLSHSHLGSSVGTTGSAGLHTPVSSYMPSGVHDNIALPMGKYYPTNYENRMASNSNQYKRPSARADAAGVAHSEPQLKYRRENSRLRTGSDAKRLVEQYQRDMVAQASMALFSNASSMSPSTRISDNAALKNIQLGATMLKTHKPLSPRLVPLGSPGPVTPMELDGNGDGYLSRGRAAVGLDAGSQNADIARVIRVEERQRIEVQSPGRDMKSSF